MAEGKSTYRSALEAVERMRKKADSLKERTETIAGEGMRTVVSGVTAFTTGLADQRFGAADKETGIRVHKTNGAPSSLLVAGALKGAAVFGMFGKVEAVGYAAGDGVWNSAANTWGRQAGERLRIKAVATETAAKNAQTSAKAEARASEAKAA